MTQQQLLKDAAPTAHRPLKGGYRGQTSGYYDIEFDPQDYGSQMAAHAVDITEPEDAIVSSERARLTTFGVLLEGQLQFAINDTWQHVCADPTKNSQQAQFFVLNTLSNCNWQRRLIRHNKLRKIVLTMKPQWLEEKLTHYGLLNNTRSEFLSTHAAFTSWPCNTRRRGRRQLTHVVFETTTKLLKSRRLSHPTTQHLCGRTFAVGAKHTHQRQRDRPRRHTHHAISGNPHPDAAQPKRRAQPKKYRQSQRSERQHNAAQFFTQLWLHHRRLHSPSAPRNRLRTTQ